MPSLENRRIHPLGSFKSYPRRCLAVSHRSLPRRYCCSHTLKYKWRSFDWFVCCSFHKRVRCLLLYQQENKIKIDPPASPLFLFFQKAPLMVRQHIPVPFPACTGDSACSGASQKHLHQCRQHEEQTGGARKTMYSYREMTSLGSWRHGGMVHTTEALHWMGTGSSGKAGWESKEGDLPFIWESSWMYGALPGGGWGASQELVGHD